MACLVCVCSQGEFYTVVEVPEGTHQYKYYIDGDWKCHPNEVCCLSTDMLICNRSFVS